jgi:hypothetical protein
MADEFVPYIKYDAKVGGYYPTIELLSLPFPASNIPQLFNLRIFIIEQNERGYFLRSTLNSLFCQHLIEQVRDIDLPDFDAEQSSYKYDENGEVIFKSYQLKYLAFNYEGKERAVAYNFAGKGECFLQMHTSEVPFAEFDERLRNLYIAATMLTEHSLAFYSNEILKMDMKKKTLNPKGKWEDEMFKNVFQSNTNAMTDDEYLMIFGVER